MASGKPFRLTSNSMLAALAVLVLVFTVVLAIYLRHH